MYSGESKEGNVKERCMQLGRKDSFSREGESSAVTMSLNIA